MRIQYEPTHEIANLMISLSRFIYFCVVYIAVDLYNYNTLSYNINIRYRIMKEWVLQNNITARHSIYNKKDTLFNL